jgi:uncharacterized membrane protein YuzA (DUF378 family)
MQELDDQTGVLMWAIDHSSMILIILGGFDLGIRGLFGIDIGEQYLGSYAKAVYILIGIAAVWQLRRQRFPIG